MTGQANMLIPNRPSLFPEVELPSTADLVARGRQLAHSNRVGTCAFLQEFSVSSEAEYKRQRIAEGALMLHAQIGYRDLTKSSRCYAEVHAAIDRLGGRIDRYGICLDWSMGYPRAVRREMPRGTGLILEEAADFAALTRQAPVAPHFGDFVIGMPAALENTIEALGAGATSIGNLGQYFTFRLPGWSDDVGTTASTVEALALLAAQPVEILIHSNLDDGFASLFHDLACSFGAAQLERYIVEELMGGRVSHCFGHTFAEPLTRLAFQRALAMTSRTPGTMIYGNTTTYQGSGNDNYAALGSYLMVDVVGQRLKPSGHAVNPVPTTEAARIPDIEEIVDAHCFALRLIERSEGMAALIETRDADAVAAAIISGGERFLQNVLAGLERRGVAIDDPFEMLLALRRIGARRLEAAFGPGMPGDGGRAREPIVPATTIKALDIAAEKLVARLDPTLQAAIRGARLVACVGTSDVHEYGKVLIEHAMRLLGIEVIDLGVHVEPASFAEEARRVGADLVAVSTYNGVALSYIQRLQRALAGLATQPAVLVGGRLNQLREGSNSSLPVDVVQELWAAGVLPCGSANDMLTHLAVIAQARAPASSSRTSHASTGLSPEV